MTNEEIIREFSALPPEARREAEDFIAFLRARYDRKTEKTANSDLREESFIGMWKDREDLQDSSAFVRELRETEWTK
jgi:hypothetical protein